PPARSSFPTRRSSDLSGSVSATRTVTGALTVPALRTVAVTSTTASSSSTSAVVTLTPSTARCTAFFVTRCTSRCIPQPAYQRLRSEEHTSELQSRENL